MVRQPLPLTSVKPADSWSKRNYKWLVPAICGGGILTILACAALTYWLAYGHLKATADYREAVARARTNPAVTRALGTPITEGRPIAARGGTRHSADSMFMDIPISGPKGTANIIFAASKSTGHQTNEHLMVLVAKTFQIINLDDPRQNLTNH